MARVWWTTIVVMQRRESISRLLLPAIVLVASTIVIQRTGLDPLISDHFYDFDRAVWPLRDHWLTQTVIHHLGRAFVELVGLGGLLVWLGSWVLPSWCVLRRRAAYLTLTMAVAIAVVSLAKYGSIKHCPWDMQRYGGSVPLQPFFSPGQPGTCAGHCFPASHALTGFSLMALHFVFRDRSRILGRIGLWTGLVAGTVFSIGQVARGAHFFSHGIWSAVLCWYICLGMYEIVFQRRLESPGDQMPSAEARSARGRLQPVRVEISR